MRAIKTVHSHQDLVSQFMHLFVFTYGRQVRTSSLLFLCVSLLSAMSRTIGVISHTYR
jgi:hypothetical protein